MTWEERVREAAIEAVLALFRRMQSANPMDYAQAAFRAIRPVVEEEIARAGLAHNAQLHAMEQRAEQAEAHADALAKSVEDCCGPKEDTLVAYRRWKAEAEQARLA